MRKAKVLMIQGTMSSVGKSLTVAGLCRIFKQDGYRVCPFKSQNMALNSFVTEEGLEMGRAQVMQAEACGIKPSVYMNPILLKPTDDQGSQVIVNGEAVGNMRAAEYFNYKQKLVPEIIHAYEELEKDADIIVIEGAGSPAEINLKENDIVNMGMAALVDAPVLLVGDIDRGGVFAQLIGTADLLEPGERGRIRGFVINKFRGDEKLLKPGLDMIEDKSHIPVLGVVPYMDINLEDEDSLTDKFSRSREAGIMIGVIRLPHISNFTDFDVFEQFENVSVRFISDPGELEQMDMIILPGTKNTISDMEYLKRSGLETAIIKYSYTGRPIWGICGGYQMLGRKISDPGGEESGGEITGLSLLDVDTVIRGTKCRKQTTGTFTSPYGVFKNLAGLSFEGYEIHMGETKPVGSEGAGQEIWADGEHDKELYALNPGEQCEFTSGQTGYCRDNIFGTYIHGIFDRAQICSTVVKDLAEVKGIQAVSGEYADFKELKDREYDRLADTLRKSLDMKAIYDIMGL